MELKIINGYWNFEEGSGSTVFDLTSNENNGNIIGATYSTNAPELSCPLTSVTGCDSVAVLNLTIIEPDHLLLKSQPVKAILGMIVLILKWHLFSNTASNNNYSMSFDGLDDQVSISSNLLSQSLPSGNNDRSGVFSYAGIFI